MHAGVLKLLQQANLLLLWHFLQCGSTQLSVRVAEQQPS